MKTIKFGFIGYPDLSGISEPDKISYQNGILFCVRNAENLFTRRFGEDTKFEMVSLLNNESSKYVYQYASHKAKKQTYIKTVGFVLGDSTKESWFPVDEQHNSDGFLEYIDVLFKMGDGDKETELFKKFKEIYPEKMAEEAEPFHKL